MKIFAVTLPGGQVFDGPQSIPQGGISSFQTALGSAVEILIIFAIIIAITFIAWAGFQWATSGGDKAKLSAARAKLTWSIIGLVIVFLAFALVSFVAFFFKIPGGFLF